MPWQQTNAAGPAGGRLFQFCVARGIHEQYVAAADMRPFCAAWVQVMHLKRALQEADEKLAAAKKQ